MQTVKMLELGTCQEIACTERQHYIGKVVFRFCASHTQDIENGKELILKG
ncbi:hypothetical protein LCGC14_0665210 [marine sediment metagenome]|uniref:Uncharacterized protein n=1 Tax=marine sediment metagenome TaxID=412755 RepID=A0A0F9QSB6_9ZZZZ